MGFPLFHGRVQKDDFQFLIEKMQSKLSGWKGRLHNKAGRVTLAKVVLTAIPVYHMHTVWLPQTTCDDIDRIVCNFVWEGGGERSLHLFNWSTITRSKQEGGLGFRQARNTNVTMLGKLLAEIHGNFSKL